ncbi:MAG: carboxylesterase family protein [Polyangiales bacterium]
MQARWKWLAVRGLAALTALTAQGARPAHAQPSAANDARVTIDAGTLRGETAGGVARYLGVPFAKPPVGALRWAPPEPPAPWEGERDATKYQLPCYQTTDADGTTVNAGGVSGPSSEDCLYLNVYAPAKADGRAPVMVWFYGGGNEVGGAHLGTYDGQSFAERGVVVVTLNYRLGAAGWFAHPKLTAAAAPSAPLVSYGSMDQTEALRWVQRNIARFGGDAKNVTIFGQSAGGYGVYAQLVAPSAQGLFHKAMVHSATYVRANPSLAEVEARGVQRATSWGLDGATATLDQLRSVPVEKLGGGVGGAVDGRYFVEPWMTSLPYKRHARVPFVVGGNSGEGTLWARDRWIASQFAEAGVPAFQYHFSHVRQSLDRALGAQHSAELRFVWNTLRDWTSAENDAVADAMHPCWVAFAFYDGSGPIDCGNGIVWPAFTQTEHPVVEFTTAGPTVHKQFRTDEAWVDALRAR